MNELKIDKFPKEFKLRDKFYPILVANINKNEKKLMTHIAKYRDKNSKILSSPYLTDYPIFSREDENIVMNSCGIDILDMKKTSLDTMLLSGPASKTRERTGSGKQNFEPCQITIILLMKYYIETKQEKKLNMMSHYLAYSMYWSIFTNSFRKFKPREETMIYTIDNLSYKFLLKNLKSIDALLFYGVDQIVNYHKERILSASDAEISYVIDGAKTKISNYFKQIAEEYFDNYENNEVILMGDDSLEDGSQRDTKSMGGDVDMLANEYTTKFFSEQPRRDIINQISKLKNVGVTDLQTTLTLLVDDQSVDDVRAFYESIFYLYFSSGNNASKNIKSLSFLGTMESIYKKGNSTDKNIRKIKELMNKWLEKGSATYRATNRLATKNDFRKSIFYYFIFLVSTNK